MSKGNFKKIENSDKCIFGPRKLLLTGFAAGVHGKFATLIESLGVSNLALVWATEEQAETTVNDLAQLPDGSGAGQSSSLPRSIIAGGISEKELQGLISGCRKAGLKQVLWATLTPVSVSWPLAQLLSELTAEHVALSRKK